MAVGLAVGLVRLAVWLVGLAVWLVGLAVWLVGLAVGLVRLAVGLVRLAVGLVRLAVWLVRLAVWLVGLAVWLVGLAVGVVGAAGRIGGSRRRRSRPVRCVAGIRIRPDPIARTRNLDADLRQQVVSHPLRRRGEFPGDGETPGPDQHRPDQDSHEPDACAPRTSRRRGGRGGGNHRGAQRVGHRGDGFPLASGVHERGSRGRPEECRDLRIPGGGVVGLNAPGEEPVGGVPIEGEVPHLTQWIARHGHRVTASGATFRARVRSARSCSARTAPGRLPTIRATSATDRSATIRRSTTSA